MGEWVQRSLCLSDWTSPHSVLRCKTSSSVAWQWSCRCVGLRCVCERFGQDLLLLLMCRDRRLRWLDLACACWLGWLVNCADFCLASASVLLSVFLGGVLGLGVLGVTLAWLMTCLAKISALSWLFWHLSLVFALALVLERWYCPKQSQKSVSTVPTALERLQIRIVASLFPL